MLLERAVRVSVHVQEQPLLPLAESQQAILWGTVGVLGNRRKARPTTLVAGLPAAAASPAGRAASPRRTRAMAPQVLLLCLQGFLGAQQRGPVAPPPRRRCQGCAVAWSAVSARRRRSTDPARLLAIPAQPGAIIRRICQQASSKCHWARGSARAMLPPRWLPPNPSKARLCRWQWRLHWKRQQQSPILAPRKGRWLLAAALLSRAL